MNFFFILSNLYIKKNFFFKCKFFFLIFNLKIRKKFFNNNYVVLYYLKNNGNINSCIRTCNIFNIISVVDFKKKKYIVNIYNNIIYIKNFLFFSLFFKKKVFLALTIKAYVFLKKIKKIKKFILIIGNEKKSLIKKINNKIDIFLKIKTYRKKSLNTSVINGIVLNYLK
ncbi:MAG: TrmH family RNA methyltransferase [Candidatus Carsonella ruddii]